MQEKFKADTDLLLKTLNAINTGIAVINEDGNFIYVNEKYSRIYGYGHEELIGKNYLVIIPEEEHENVIEFNREFLKSGKITSHEWKRKRQDGTFIYVHATMEVICDNNDCRNIAITIDDVTNIKDMQMTAAKSEELRRLIMNAALDAIICIDKNDVITLWNPQAEKIFGWTKEEVMGQTLADIIIPEMYREMHKRGMKKYLETGVGPALNTLLELTAVNRLGHEFPIELTVLPIKQEHEEEIFCAFIRDITERKKSETVLKELNSQMSKNIEELAKSNIELEQFAYIASHDLQEPLRMVTNFLTQLDKRYHEQLDDKGKQYLNFAVDGAVRMRKIILDLLEYSRVGKVETSYEKVDLDEVLAVILKVNKASIDELNAIVCAESLPVIYANKTSILQLFQNLLGNALKYHNQKKPPHIIINAAEHDEFWQFSISDNGIGIDKRYFDKIFILFQRLHNKEEYSGTGIGLAICKKIVESHGGRIWVESEAGQGSTFYFTIKK